MMKKTTRKLKVYSQSGYRYKDTPTIMLKGQWLERLGFDCGDQIEVECGDKRIVISKIGSPDVDSGL